MTSNTEKAGATREESFSKASDSDRRLSSGDSVDLANRCPTCLLEIPLWLARLVLHVKELRALPMPWARPTFAGIALGTHR